MTNVILFTYDTSRKFVEKLLGYEYSGTQVVTATHDFEDRQGTFKVIKKTMSIRSRSSAKEFDSIFDVEIDTDIDDFVYPILHSDMLQDFNIDMYEGLTVYFKYK